MTATTKVTQGIDQGETSQGSLDTLTAVLGALYDINRHRDANTLAREIVSVVPRAIACDSAIFARVEAATRSFTFSAWPTVQFADVDHNDAVRLHCQDHPLLREFPMCQILGPRCETGGKSSIQSAGQDRFNLINRKQMLQLQLQRMSNEEFDEYVEHVLATLVPPPAGG